jgi:hypothetical protein
LAKKYILSNRNQGPLHINLDTVDKQGRRETVYLGPRGASDAKQTPENALTEEQFQSREVQKYILHGQYRRGMGIRFKEIEVEDKEPEGDPAGEPEALEADDSPEEGQAGDTPSGDTAEETSGSRAKKRKKG